MAYREDLKLLTLNSELIEGSVRRVVAGCPDDPRFDEVDPAGMAKAWRFFENSQMGYAVGLFDDRRIGGVLLGIRAPDPLTGLVVGTAYLWAVIPEFRKLGGAKMLLADFEVWARKTGAQKLVIGAVESPKADKLARAYRMMGYEPATRGFQKRMA